MKRSKLLVLLITLMLALAIALVACTPPPETDTRDDGRAISVAGTEIVAGADYFEFALLNADNYAELIEEKDCETSFDEVLWETKYRFEGLEPNTQYSIYVRYKETESRKAGPTCKFTVTTLKMTPTTTPNATILQQNNVVTVVDPNDEFEVYFNDPWDSKVKYSNEKTHAYPIREGTVRHKILVRYKETDKSLVSEPQEIPIHIGAFYAGTGTKTDPYVINKFEHLKVLDEAIYDSENGYNCYFKLLNDITFPEVALTESLDSNVVRLTNKINLDGNGFKFINPKMVDLAKDSVGGLFRSLSSASNLTVENADIKVKSSYNIYRRAIIGILGGRTSESPASFTNCHVSGKINVNYTTPTLIYGVMIGALTGEATVIENCSSDVSITYNNSSNDVPQGAAAGVFIGGLAGKATTIKNSFSKVNISSTTQSGFVTVGGLVGEATSKAVIENSFAVGQNQANEIVIDATGVRDGQETEVVQLGGLIGRLVGGTVKNVYADINLSVGARTINSIVGGVIGVSDYALVKSKLENAFYNGRIAESGGLAAYLFTVAWTLGDPLIVENSYHDATMPNLGTGTGKIDNASSTAASQEDLLSVTWQKANLKFDENIWEFTDGKLPQLKK